MRHPIQHEFVDDRGGDDPAAETKKRTRSPLLQERVHFLNAHRDATLPERLQRRPEGGIDHLPRGAGKARDRWCQRHCLSGHRHGNGGGRAVAIITPASDDASAPV